MPALDLIQRLREALVAVLDTHPLIVAVTGRALYNVVAWGSLEDEDDSAGDRFPVIAYHVVVSRELAADGDTQDLDVQLTAFSAVSEAQANELLNAAKNAIQGPAFTALPAPLDVIPVRRVRRARSRDAEGNYGADLDVTLRVYQPEPA